MFHPIDKWNVRLGIALDVDLKITLSQNVPSHLKITKNGENNNDQKIYASMARMSSNEKRSSEKYGESSQFTNLIFDLESTYHMISEVSDFIT